MYCKVGIRSPPMGTSSSTLTELRTQLMRFSALCDFSLRRDMSSFTFAECCLSTLHACFMHLSTNQITLVKCDEISTATAAVCLSSCTIERARATSMLCHLNCRGYLSFLACCIADAGIWVNGSSMYKEHCKYSLHGLSGIRCLSVGGWLFTIFFTYTGFASLIAGVFWGADLHRKIPRGWREIRNMRANVSDQCERCRE